MQRRTVLKSLAAAGAALCPTCASIGTAWAAGEPHAHDPAPHWGYAGDSGPERWPGLASDFEVCGAGAEQSPVDLRDAVPARLETIGVRYSPMPLRVVNNRHTIQANCEPGSGIDVGGERWALVQFHFHHPSEHRLAGEAFPMEIHLVHTAPSGLLAVLGVFVEPGAANRALAPIWRAVVHEAGPEEAVVSEHVSPADLLPVDRAYFLYAGSLTTPPCSQTVTWRVFKRSITASADQIARFAKLFPMNARPVQELNRRFLLEST